jgi:hypothetical protein
MHQFLSRPKLPLTRLNNLHQLLQLLLYHHPLFQLIKMWSDLLHG